MNSRHISTFFLIGVFLSWFATSVSQDPDVLDSISSIPDCDPDPNPKYRRFQNKRDATGFSIDATNQDLASSPDNLDNSDDSMI